MRNLLFLLALAPAVALAQVQASASFSIDLPVILPQLVVVTPGIQVVPDLDVEVFRVDGYYWTRHDGRWYRSRDHRGGWKHMKRGIPPGLSKIPPGKYRRWRPAPAARFDDRRHDGGHRYERRDRHDDRHDDHGGKKRGKHRGKHD